MIARRALFLLLLSACAAPPPPPPPTPPRLNPDLVQRGGLLFLNPALSGDGTRSCDTCHPGAESDGRVYRDGEEVGAGTPGGRNSPMLRGLWQSAPYLWDGSLTTLPEVIDRMLRVEMRGGRLAPHDAAALEAYLLSLAPFDRRRIDAEGIPREPSTLRQRNGREIFARIECIECHPPPAFMKPRSADVGTGGRFDVPTLLGLGSSPPYGHDGRWSSVEEAVDAILDARGIELRALDREWLLEYLKLL